MKNINKIALFLIGFLLVSSNFSKSVVGTMEIGTYKITGGPGWYYIWNVTETINARMTESYPYRPIYNGDKFRLSIISSSFFPYTYAYPEIIIGDNPCIVGSIDYYNKTYDTWTSLTHTEMFFFGSTNYYAMLIYNLTSGLLWTAQKIATKYFLTIIPNTISLSDFGSTLTNKYSQITSYSSTSNTLNLTISSLGYNYVEVDTSGVVSKWIYNYSSSKIVAEFESSDIYSLGLTIPFGSEYIISAGICIIGLIYVVKKRSIINKKTQ